MRNTNLAGKNNYVTDFNLACDPGRTYYGDFETLHKPTAGLYYYVWVVGYDSDMLTQYATITNGLTDKIWYRKYVRGTWSEWDYFVSNLDFGYVRADVDGGQSWIWIFKTVKILSYIKMELKLEPLI